jgi:hypothetical protein
MIAKNVKGKSFGGCVRYVLNEGHEILEAEGVVAEDASTITRDFAIQRSGRPEIKQPVGHIAIAFSPEDSPRMTNDFMLDLAHEYMDEMGIGNTQYIVVRHHNTDHDHFHIVYNRIDNDLKLISVNNDYHRNVAACKKLKDRHGLTYGMGKEKVNRQKLTGAEKVKYQIHDEIAANLPKCADYADLEKRLRQAGITIQYKYRSGAEESSENIQGVSFAKGKMTFKGSQIDRKFSHANISKILSANLNEAWEKMKDIIIPEIEPMKKEPDRQVTSPIIPLPEPPKSSAPEAQKQAELPRPTKKNPTIGGVRLTDEQWETLQSGGHIYLENMEKKDGSGQFSAYVFTTDETKKAFFSGGNPDKMVEHGGVTIRLRDKILVERGYVVKAKMKWWGGIDYQHPFVWKDPVSGEIKHSFADPHTPKEQIEKEKLENRIQRPPAVNRTPPPPRTVPPKRTVPPPTKGPKRSR